MKAAQIILICISAILGYFANTKWKDLSKIGRFSVMAGMLTALLIARVSCQENQKQELLEKIQASFGQIEDIKGATYPIVRVGKSTTTFTGKNGVYGWEAAMPSFKIYAIKNKLYVSTIIRDFDGKVIAAIDENEWTMFKNENFEYNNDYTGFEVVSKGDRKVYFQIELKEGYVFVSGLFMNEFKNGSYWYYNANDSQYDVGLELVRGGIPPAKFYTIHISPLFKYPRERWYGIRDIN